MLEPNAARLAAQRASENDLAEIEAIHEQFCASLNDPDAASLLDVAFHRAVAVSVHNPLVTLILDSLEPILVEIRTRTLGLSGRPNRAVEAHGQILERLRMRDPEGAERAMREHLHESLQVWRQLDAH
jgi:DNA-binding FadR family transcriptional regulator